MAVLGPLRLLTTCSYDLITIIIYIELTLQPTRSRDTVSYERFDTHKLWTAHLNHQETKVYLSGTTQQALGLSFFKKRFSHFGQRELSLD